MPGTRIGRISQNPIQNQEEKDALILQKLLLYINVLHNVKHNCILTSWEYV